MNIRSEDMAELHHQGIAIDDDNDPVPEHFPRQGYTTAGTGNWKKEGIICLRKDYNQSV